ncbi:hypothetical protein DICPUDRAFT_155049 [Dictyostelium purpureum]|uniref:Uncharacterized protein n=1 Tax=Dictyostelium purpureum TaxID=5786 RepID=F0ZSY3_DICPU|nr:uncharacterized protein DICPUDRAFT_155049 [Dictyostelium purpureum]EGC32947.1 hypothetical protein DICPUDRAFT_155049 [Dictyostelium purpureum]|eukprot:XP_003290513.1 hypothetical protein DICPUDRAFT_155049 [Dictyostelium purpureum]
MKLLLVLLFISFYYSFGQQQFVNFHPYAASHCADIPYGVGFSVATNKCLNDLDYFYTGYQYYSYFTRTLVNSSNQTLVFVTQYGQRNCSGPEVKTSYYINNTCDISPLLDQKKFSPYSYVTVTNKPSFTDNSIVNAVYSNDQGSSSADSPAVCSSGNLLFASIMTDGFKATFPSGAYEFFNCVKKQPFLYSCLNNNCKNIPLTLACSSNQNGLTNESCFCSV